MIIIVILLAGCWDERLYKEYSVVSLVGVEGEIGNVKAYYSYPEAATGSSELVIIESEGKTPREARTDADSKVEEKLDVSMMSAFLIGMSAAEEGLLDFLDIYYREPSSSISTLMILVEGDVKQYLEVSKPWSAEAGEFYSRLVETNEETSIVPRYTVQTAGAMLYTKGMDLTLPYIKMDEAGERPEIGGVALFSDDKFSGHIIEKDKSVYLGLLMPKKKGHASLSYLYENKPLSVTVLKMDGNWDITSSNSIKLKYDMTVELDEYKGNGLRNIDVVEEVEQFLSKEIKKELLAMIETLQNVKCDAIGVGKFVRAKDYSMFKEKDWHEKFAELDIEVELETHIVKVGIVQ